MGNSFEHRQGRVRWQIEYYFSESNLVRDTYLRCLMDEDGWVPLVLLATFPKVAREGLELSQVVDALTQSSEVVVSAVVADDEESSHEQITNQALVRKAVDWSRWPLKGATFIPNNNPFIEEQAELDAAAAGHLAAAQGIPMA